MYKNPLIQSIGSPTFANAGISADTLRLDLIHPEISGNKWYKLKYHLERAVASGKKGMLSFGGAYSNHLVAMAFACREKTIPCAAVIRGEEPPVYGPSLQQMSDYGMELHFVSREEYKQKEQLTARFANDYYIVPEGGAGIEGIKGASEIMQFPGNDHYTHILCSVGTGTTMAGIINGSQKNQKVIGISSLKVNDPVNNELISYIKEFSNSNNYEILFNYHFGGYAKKRTELISFMNRLYREESIPVDFVYTGKLFYAAYDLTTKNYFPVGSRLLIIHSGGLQGNRSLEKGTLIF
ncbi:MAG: pyridoxal-phosphate dependent enzyme [Chitinophagaceae bacterium]|nr:pyridoxal-phosphate dependent enzyme [Chitinophagaceae bacterium]